MNPETGVNYENTSNLFLQSSYSVLCANCEDHRGSMGDDIGGRIAVLKTDTYS